MGWSDLIGRTLGDDDRYEILEELGRGGSGRVYRAHDRQEERDVAIKVLPNDAEDRQGFVRRFQREVQAIEQLHHPNIVAVYGRGQTEDLVFLVMQYVTGGTLRSRLGKSLPIAETAGAIIQMAHALHHAHQNGVIHRDVKPSNMLVDGENPRRLLLSDFGTAKMLGLGSLTKSGTTIGTPEYMAPEQAEGQEIDHRADVYALGCVLYEALAGRPPFTGPTPVSVLYQQVHSRPPYLRAMRGKEIPPDLALVVQRALAKRPEDRFPSAWALAQALYPFTEGREAAVDSGTWLPVGTATAGDASTPESPSNPTGHRWGAEGLDAIFPDDPEAQRARRAALEDEPTAPLLPAASSALPGNYEDTPLTERPTMPPDTPSLAVPISERHTQPPVRRKPATVPITPFRLPAKPTQPLYMPTTPDGSLDVEALMAQLEAEREDAGDAALPFIPDADAAAPPRRPPPRPHLTLGPGPAGSTDTPLSQGQPGRGGRASRRGRGHSSLLLWVATALVTAVILSVTVWIGVSASGLAFMTAPKGTVVPAATATATSAPTATATSAPSPSATPNAQKQLDAEAAASFRAITLSAFADNSCSPGNQRTNFSAPATVYIDLCAAHSVAPGPATVTLRQNGQVYAVVVQNLYLSPSGSYYFYRYGISAGSYDALITMSINGKTATAKDIAFTVG
jgi:serine/threonine protein kinase